MTARISLILREARAHRARLQLLFRSEDQLRHRKPCGITLFRVRFSWASLFRWYALKNARVPPAIVLSRLRRGKNGQTPARRSQTAPTVLARNLPDGHRPPLQPLLRKRENIDGVVPAGHIG